MNAGATHAPAASPAARLAAWLDDRLNPVLVKELRQILRGKLFMRAFFGVQTLGLVLALLALVDAEPERAGPQMLEVAYGSALLLTALVLPLQAFLSFGAERDPEALESLQLTRLRPRSIVLGKFFASVLLSLVGLAALSPLYATALLLPGVELSAALVTLVLPFVSGALLTATWLGAAALGRARFLRAVLLLALIGLTLVYGVSVLFAFELSSLGAGLGWHLWLHAIGAFVAIHALVVAAGIVAHPEEDAWRPLRVAGALAAGAALVAVALLGKGVAALGVAPWGPSDVESFAWLGLGGLWLGATGYALEPLPLPRHAAQRVSRSRVLALLEAPWLGGGARGFAFFLLLGTTYVGGLYAIASAQLGAAALKADSFLAPLSYFVFVLGLPALVFRTSRRGAPRAGARFLTLVTPVLLFAVATLLRAMLGDTALEGLGNPGSIGSTRVPGAIFVSMTAALLVVAVHAFSMSGGIREVLAASRRRREAAA